jgi:hypothetical protein
MKKILIVVIVVSLVVALTACGNALEAAVSQMAEEENTAQSSESSDLVDDSSADASMDIDISEDGGSINISGEDGNINIQGDENGMPWPSDKLPSSVPEISGVTVVMVMDMDEGVMVAFEDCDQAAAESYISTIKGSGWSTDMELNSDDGYTGIFSNGNETLTFGWSSSDATGSVMYGMTE